MKKLPIAQWQEVNYVGFSIGKKCVFMFPYKSWHSLWDFLAYRILSKHVCRIGCVFSISDWFRQRHVISPLCAVCKNIHSSCNFYIFCLQPCVFHFLSIFYLKHLWVNWKQEANKLMRENAYIYTISYILQLEYCTLSWSLFMKGFQNTKLHDQNL